MSAFAIEDGVVYHTYSTYARGLDGLWAPTSGSTGRRRDETKRASGGDAMTSTTSRLSQPITLFSKREASDAELSPDRVAAGLGGRA